MYLHVSWHKRTLSSVLTEFWVTFFIILILIFFSAESVGNITVWWGWIFWKSNIYDQGKSSMWCFQDFK